jgi:alpha-ketoglutarate-dependent taurine dioxygenase
MTIEVSPLVIAKQQTYADTRFPYVFRCENSHTTLDEAIAWVQERKDELLEAAGRHGAVLFRDFPLQSAEDFDQLVRAFGLSNFPYAKSMSNAVRVNRTERVFSANEAPPEVKIFFHHEMAQTPIFPARIFFFCEVAAEDGGATPICRSDVLYDRLNDELPEFIAACETRGLKYTNVMPGADDPNSGMGRSWQSTLSVETREQAEARLNELGYQFEWQDDDCLRVTSPVLPAVRRSTGGRKVFFNQLIAAWCGWKDTRNDPSDAVCHGDGSKLDADAVMRAVDIAYEMAFDVPWQAGDAVLIDNTLVMHGRRPFKGTRKVLASLADAQSNLS